MIHTFADSRTSVYSHAAKIKSRIKGKGSGIALGDWVCETSCVDVIGEPSAARWEDGRGGASFVIHSYRPCVNGRQDEACSQSGSIECISHDAGIK